MKTLHPNQGIGTLAVHAGHVDNKDHAHVTPIFQTSTFDYDDSAAGAALFAHEVPGYSYTRLGNPNQHEVAKKIAVLEGLDLLRSAPNQAMDDLVAGQMFSSGMAAITTAILSTIKSGQAIIAQKAVYSATFNYLNEILPRYGIHIEWIEDPTPEKWGAAFQIYPHAVLVYAESPSNPAMSLVDLAAAADIAHAHGAWLMVDNTFATPYCQRPLGLGADLVVHSTTKYLSGHGVIIGGALVSPHVDFMHTTLRKTMEIMGTSASPFDCWLTMLGLKTFELRMQRHTENAMVVARFLEQQPEVERVYYPGLESHPQHALARSQMLNYGAMMSFELKGGLQAGIRMMDKVRLCTLAVSLGNVDTLISHPASTTHSTVPTEQRRQMGISDGLVRLSVGVENVEDLLADLAQALK